MEIIGSIDNAVGRLPDIGKAVYHLFFTYGRLLIIRVQVRKQEMNKNPVHMADPYSDPRGFKLDMELAQKGLIDEALKRGVAIEKDLDVYISKHHEEIIEVNYSDISDAEFSGGTVFSLPHLNLQTEIGELKFKLIHNNYEKAGKLTQQVYDSYFSTLEKALGEKLRTK